MCAGIAQQILMIRSIFMIWLINKLRLPFNNINYDTSDPAPLDQRYMVVSLAGQTGSRGGYDLYIADSLSSSVWPLPINTNLNELGAFIRLTNQ